MSERKDIHTTSKKPQNLIVSIDLEGILKHSYSKAYRDTTDIIFRATLRNSRQW